MTNFAKKITAIVVTMLVSLVALVGCTYKFTPLPGGNADAVTTNNNSMVVTQGDYIYFMNGNVAYDAIKEVKDNTYGEVTKGAIYRAKKDGSEAKVLVPQIAMNKTNKYGLTVLGGYIYFTSPSTSKDKAGKLQTTFTDFYRVKLDGSKIEKIVTVNTNTMDYQFTDKGLFYVNESKLYYVSYSEKIGKPEVVAEKYDSVAIGNVSTYDPNGKNVGLSAVFAKTPEETNGKVYNKVSIVKADGTTKELLDGSKDGAEIKYTVKDIIAEGEELVLYYEKQTTVNGTTENSPKGLFAQKFNADLEPVGAEKQMTDRTGLTVRYISYDAGVYVFENKEMFIPDLENGTAIKTYKTGDSITKDNILDIRNDNGKQMLYFITSNGALNRVEMLASGVSAESETGFGVAENLIEKNIKNDGLKSVLVGDTFYYINSNYNNYLFTANINGGKHKLLGERTEADLTAYIKQVESMKEADRIAHDKLIDDTGIDIKAFEG